MGPEYEEGKKYLLTPRGRNWTDPEIGGGYGIFRGDHFERAPETGRGCMTEYPFGKGYEYEVTPVDDEPTWTLPGQWVTTRHAEWAAQTVETLAKVGIPTEDIPNALRLVARLQEWGIDNAAEVAGIAHGWLVASRG